MKVKIYNGPNGCYMSKEDEKKVVEMINKYIEEKKGEQIMIGQETKFLNLFKGTSKKEIEKDVYTEDEKQFLFTYIMGMNIKLNLIFRLIINIVKKPDVNYDDILKQFEDLTKIDKGE